MDFKDVGNTELKLDSFKKEFKEFNDNFTEIKKEYDLLEVEKVNDTFFKKGIKDYIKKNADFLQKMFDLKKCFSLLNRRVSNEYHSYSSAFLNKKLSIDKTNDGFIRHNFKVRILDTQNLINELEILIQVLNSRIEKSRARDNSIDAQKFFIYSIIFTIVISYLFYFLGNLAVDNNSPILLNKIVKTMDSLKVMERNSNTQGYKLEVLIKKLNSDVKKK